MESARHIASKSFGRWLVMRRTWEQSGFIYQLGYKTWGGPSGRLFCSRGLDSLFVDSSKTTRTGPDVAHLI